MAITNTYVTSVNGKRGEPGGDLGSMSLIPDGSGDYELVGPSDSRHNVLWLDANDFRVNGTSGNTIPQGIQGLASTMRPLLLEKIGDSDDYVMQVQAGIPWEPVIE